MKKLALASALAIVASSTAAVAAEHSGKVPFEVHARPGFECVSFQLEGVAVADPAVSTRPWFSLPKAHPHFAELFAILMTAKAGRLPVRVETVGTACNNASIDVISIL